MVADASYESRPRLPRGRLQDPNTRHPTIGLVPWDPKVTLYSDDANLVCCRIDAFIKEKRIYAWAVEEQGLLETVVEQDFKYYKLTFLYYRCKHGILAKPTTLLLTLKHIIAHNQRLEHIQLNLRLQVEFVANFDTYEDSINALKTDSVFQNLVKTHFFFR
ncbi:hypothetical protein JTB14_032456 [Gonioctena quinquepunctata]|nr:hypothetical protein JTB14_032456 [Gonioctena quinquepunctata]